VEYRELTCPCCGKKVSIPIDPASRDFDFNYSILINSYEEFFDMVDMCPECGYVFLFEKSVDEDEREYIASDEYKNILNDKDMDEGLKKWVLYAVLSEHVENFTEAGIAYMKAYDYLELKNMDLNKRFIEKSASCFLASAEKKVSFTETILAVDCLRRDGEFEQAKGILDLAKDTFEGGLVDALTDKEAMWIDLKETAKRYLDI